MSHRPSLRQLEYLVALDRERSFRAAARACLVTQPALSTQIRQLEQRLGVVLFERDRRAVRATEIGAALADRARRILGQVDELVAAAAERSEPLCGTLRLGVIPTVAPYALPAAVPALRRRFPRMRLLLREDRTDQLLEGLQAGELDVLLLALEADLGEVAEMALYADPFVLAVPRGHPLAGRPKVSERDLAGHEVLLLEDGHCLRDQALEICQGAGAREAPDFRATSLTTLVRMVAAGTGITLLPATSVRTEIRRRDAIELVPLAPSTLSRTVGLAFRKSSPRAHEFELLAEVLEAQAPPGAVHIRRGRSPGTRAAAPRSGTPRRRPGTGSTPG